MAQRLRGDGVDAIVDQFVNGSPAEGWPLWMERQVKASDFVLVVCTEPYHRRFDAEEEPAVCEDAVFSDTVSLALRGTTYWDGVQRCLDVPSS